MTTRRVYEQAIDSVFARMDSSGNVAWYLKDHLGSVRDMVDGTGTLKDHLDFDGWGNMTTETHSTFGDRYKYTSREWDAEIRWQQDPDKAALDRGSGISCVHSCVHCCFKNHARLPLADIQGHDLGNEWQRLAAPDRYWQQGSTLEKCMCAWQGGVGGKCTYA